MSPRITAALAIALAVVVGYIFLVDRPQAQRAESAKHLVQIAPKNTTRITLVSSKGAVDLARRDATHWDVTNPIHVPAGSYVVSSLLDSVTGIVPQQSLGTAGNLKDYGLDKPAARITLTSSTGQTVTLEVGNASPVGATASTRSTRRPRRRSPSPRQTFGSGRSPTSPTRTSRRSESSPWRGRS